MLLHRLLRYGLLYYFELVVSEVIEMEPTFVTLCPSVCLQFNYIRQMVSVVITRLHTWNVTFVCSEVKRGSKLDSFSYSSLLQTYSHTHG
jgi:hypothetical protein